MFAESRRHDFTSVIDTTRTASDGIRSSSDSLQDINPASSNIQDLVDTGHNRLVVEDVHHDDSASYICPSPVQSRYRNRMEEPEEAPARSPVFSGLLAVAKTRRPACIRVG